MGKSEKNEVKVSENIINSMSEVFNLASQKELTGIEDIELNGKVSAKKVYTFVNPIGNRSTLTTYDAKIIESTEKIALALHGKKVLDFAICKEMAKLNTQETLESMGFNSIKDYGKALFDFSPVTSNQYARIGRIFIDDDYKIKSNILPQGLRKGHLIEMLAYVGEDDDISAIESLYLDGTLTDGMPTTKMRSTLKAWDNGTLAIETTATEKEDSSEKEDTTEKEDTSTVKPMEKVSGTTSEPVDTQVLIGQALHSLKEVKAIFDQLATNNQIIGYAEKISALEALASALLDAE